MKYADSIILWNAPADAPEWTPCRVLVKRILEQTKRDDDLFCNSGGGVSVFAPLSQAETERDILAAFNRLVMQDLMPAFDVHNELLKIDEYRSALNYPTRWPLDD